jgi:hypothetical protein
MICPECKAEYRAGITRCADCGAALVAVLPVEAHEAPELVPVYELHDPADLLAVESALDGAGIPFEVDDESAVPGASLGALDPVGRVAVVMVPRARAEEARVLLGENGDDEDEDDEEEWDEDDEEDWNDEDDDADDADDDDEDWDDEDEDDEDWGEDDASDDGDGDR